MDSGHPLLIPLDAPGQLGEQIVGGKAAKLARLARAGFEVPRGFCLTTRAYQAFVKNAGITATLRMELGRKSMDDMRWEEIWDAALRIRATFLAQPLDGVLRETIAQGLAGFDAATPLAVRSSAIGEDSAGRSFAGLHESIIGVRGKQALEDAVRLVWASLWSDAALLYRKELGLDPLNSRMAVLVQEMVDADRSGVAFARDPRDVRKERALIESVPGPCSLLVDGLVDPDRWELDRITHGIITWLPGQRDDDNLLVARLESQLLRALDEAAQRLTMLGRLSGHERPNDTHVEAMVRALREPSTGPITLGATAKMPAAVSSSATSGETPRQLIGQPASPGAATGTVRCVHGHDDLGRFRQGEVLVCDAIQPTMTHLVPLAGAIVERRGGMLIHGAIIARELGIPCVNGVRDAAEILNNGDLVTVDGHLGIVTVGAAEFDLELGVRRT